MSEIRVGLPSPSKRLPYFVRSASQKKNSGRRPLLRGRLMQLLNGWVWPSLAVTHFALCWRIEQPAELLWIRFFVWCATVLNVHISDRYHNSDKAPKPTRELELFWLRWDFTVITLVLATTFTLWSAHFGWHGLLGRMALICGACVLVASISAYGFFERGSEKLTLAAEIVIKLCMFVEFFPCFGYMVWMALQSDCAAYTAIYFAYLPGVVVYAIKWPRDGELVGSHDYFHVAVIVGHLLSAFFDAWHLHMRVPADRQCIFVGA